MALFPEWPSAVAGYGLFAIGSAVFLGLHSAYAMQILPSPAHRGRDLGILNLTNTLPALLGPALTWSLSTTERFTPVLLTLAVLTLIGRSEEHTSELQSLMRISYAVFCLK